MKKLLLAALLLSSTVYAQEIKGISIGMTKEEVQTLYPKGTAWKDGFSVGGIRAKYDSAISVKYEEDKVSSFIYFFSPSDFDIMVEAIKSKYPQLKCEDSTVQNGMGAKFTDTNCRFKNLSLTRLVSRDTSAISLEDHEANARKRAERSKKAAGDI